MAIFEVDHPASQGWKRCRIAALGLGEPDALTFVPADLATQRLETALPAHGLRGDLPVFFAALGLTQYLIEAQVVAMLHDIAATARSGGRLILQFLPPPELAGADADMLEALAVAATDHGEPWLSRFDFARMGAHLRDAGFHTVRSFDAVAAARRYPQLRDGPLHLPSYFQMVEARIG